MTTNDKEKAAVEAIWSYLNLTWGFKVWKWQIKFFLHLPAVEDYFKDKYQYEKTQEK